MRLKYTFETIDMSDEIIAVPVGKNADQLQGVIKLNNTGLEILELLKTETTKEQLVNVLAIKYEDDKEVISSYVNSILNILNDNGLIQ